ncbi:MAG: sulfurtransferase [Anaerolineales bacterium]
MLTEAARPESIVETEWVARHLDDSAIRLVEVDVDLGAYVEGHIPGAAQWDWTSHLNEPVQRNILSKDQMDRLLGESGITRDTELILYGDTNNWFAAYAFWQMKLYGHSRVKLMDGGRQKWIDEGREMTAELPNHPRRPYRASDADVRLRALRDRVLESVRGGDDVKLVDVRFPLEYAGDWLTPPNVPQEWWSPQRAGRIPGAVNIPCVDAVNEDGTFKPVDDLRELYGAKGITADKEVITYCLNGYRSSHTWFVLTQILGYTRVRNYDGSWSEYSSIVGAPIEI